MKDFIAYAVGPCYASICTSLPIDEAVRTMNSFNPTGIKSPWALSKDAHFKTGHTNPCPCEDTPETHQHYLLEC